MATTKSLKQLIAEERRTRGITRTAQAEEVGVHPGVLRRAERGVLPTPGNFIALARHFRQKTSALAKASVAR